MKYLLAWVLGVIVMLFYFKNRKPTVVKTISGLVAAILTRWVLFPCIVGIAILFVTGKL